MQTRNNTLLALDIGTRRIGVAVASAEVGFPHPLTTLAVSEDIFEEIAQLVHDNSAVTVVAGLPRGLEGQNTEQTRWVEAFVEKLQPLLDVPVKWQDEALTSRKAEDELAARGKNYAKGDVDALAATYILEDFITEHPPRSVHA